MPEFTVIDGFEKMDFDRVTALLSSAYWSLGIGKDEVMRGAANSAVVVGAFIDGRQIGYARAISDKTRFAYIADVFVDEEYRRMGVGQAMVNHILKHEELKDIYFWLLLTRDAHGVYKKCGFTGLAEPNRWMEIRTPRP